MNSRRSVLNSVGNAQHAGLWLDRFLREQRADDKDLLRRHLEDVADIKPPSGYTQWFEGWKQALTQMGATEQRYAEADKRMAVGLGDESVLETSIALHHTWGVPYIPGSALKGLAASYARQYLGADWQPKAASYVTMFGDTDQAGYVTFFDAMPLPNEFRLAPDVISIHHPKYYQGNEPPADWDDPTVVPFLTATGKYLVVVAGPNDKWITAALKILEAALKDLGIGAKTSSGYGRMKLKEFHATPVPPPPPPPPPPAKRPYQNGEVETNAVVESVVNNNNVTIRLPREENALPITKAYHGLEVGERITIKIKRVGGDGKVKEIQLA